MHMLWECDSLVQPSLPSLELTERVIRLPGEETAGRAEAADQGYIR